MIRIALPLLALGFATSAIAQTQPSAEEEEVSLRERAPSEEIIYFVLPDRFENGDVSNDKGDLSGGPLETGFDPTHKGFFHGGDLEGLMQRLDYIEGLGATAIWLAPIFKNKPVQGPPGNESAGYHGYWVTDFTRVDPHFGTNAQFKALVDAAHARGMKVYMDIITNHTADVIRYAEGEATGYAYRSKGEYPYSTRGAADGKRINQGFGGDTDPAEANWAKLTDPNFAYTPVIPEAERDLKVPAWLNEPIYYHNRGDTYWIGESSLYGDFVGLDDQFTEHPRVVEGMIEIFGNWITEYGVDGFRIDTAKHVNPEFWQTFVPAMLKRAEERGIPNFHIFGEIAYDTPTATLAAQVMEESDLPYALDMGFAKAAQLVGSGREAPRLLAEFLEQDVIYPGGAATALGLPTFLGNHDFGRYAMFLREMAPDASQEELLARTQLGHAMMFLLRGVPTVYYGDEQGFISDGNDQLAREDMFASRTEVYNDNDLLGTDATTAQENFDASHPLYRQIAELASMRQSSPALQKGLSIIRAADHEGPGLLAIERHDPESGERVLVAYNTGNMPITRLVEVDYGTNALQPLGPCEAVLVAPGSARITLPALGHSACRLQLEGTP